MTLCSNSNRNSSCGAKKTVDEFEYARLINEIIKTHSMYEVGMHVEVEPSVPGHTSGLNMIGGPKTRAIVHWAEAQINNEYIVSLSSKIQSIMA